MMIVLISHFFCPVVGGGLPYFDVGVEWKGSLVMYREKSAANNFDYYYYRLMSLVFLCVISDLSSSSLLSLIFIRTSTSIIIILVAIMVFVRGFDFYMILVIKEIMNVTANSIIILCCHFF